MITLRNIARSKIKEKQSRNLSKSKIVTLTLLVTFRIYTFAWKQYDILTKEQVIL